MGVDYYREFPTHAIMCIAYICAHWLASFKPISEAIPTVLG